MFAVFVVTLHLIRVNMPTLLPALLKTYFTWAFQESTFSKKTPRYSYSDTRLTKACYRAQPTC